MTIIASNWSSTGDAKTRDVKVNVSRTDGLVKITLVDRDKDTYMRIATDPGGAINLARMLLQVCGEEYDTPVSCDRDPKQDALDKWAAETGKGTR